MREIGGVEAAGDQAGDAVFDEVFRAAEVGDDAGDPAGERFENDISERVSGAGKEEGVGACEGAGELESAEDAGEDGVRELALEFGAVGTLADNGRGTTFNVPLSTSNVQR